MFYHYKLFFKTLKVWQHFQIMTYPHRNWFYCFRLLFKQECKSWCCFYKSICLYHIQKNAMYRFWLDIFLLSETKVLQLFPDKQSFLGNCTIGKERPKLLSHNENCYSNVVVNFCHCTAPLLVIVTLSCVVLRNLYVI